jgi:hypothetical protein
MNNSIVADASSSESNDVDFAHTQILPIVPPKTPEHQSTKPGSINAPERLLKHTIDLSNIVCEGCIEESFNLVADKRNVN